MKKAKKTATKKVTKEYKVTGTAVQVTAPSIRAEVFSDPHRYMKPFSR